MDKLKEYAAYVRKNQFWFLCGLILLVSLVSWWMVTGQLQAATAQDTLKVNGIKSQVQRIGGDANQENEKASAALGGYRNQVRGQVVGAWQASYETQFGPSDAKKRADERAAALAAKAKDANDPAARTKWLDWPEAVATSIPDDPLAPLELPVRQNYLDAVINKDEWKKLIERVNLRRPKVGGVTGEVEGIVDWDEADRKKLIDRYKPKEVPSSIWVRVTQEDLWVFESLIEIVTRMNANAKDLGFAPIKKIQKMEVGYWASTDAINRPGFELKLVEREGEGFGGGSLGEEKIADASSVNENSSPEEKDLALLQHRYLNEEMKPVSDVQAIGYFMRPDPNEPNFRRFNETLQKRGGNLENLGRPPFAEFKQMFVIMRLTMDQQRLPELLAEFSKARLPVETRQVLLDFSDIDPAKADSSVGAAPTSTGPVLEKDRGHLDADVEIRGIVYIYTRQPAATNDPSQDVLGSGAAKNPARRSLGVPTKGALEAAAATPAFEPN